MLDLKKEKTGCKIFKMNCTFKILGIEFLLMMLLFLPLIMNLENGLGLTSKLLENNGPDDYIRGWFVFPTMVIDLLGGFATVFFIFIAVLYFMGIALSVGWNRLIIHINKQKKVWILILSVVPAVLFAFEVVVKSITWAVHTGHMVILLYMLPAVLLLIETSSKAWQSTKKF